MRTAVFDLETTDFNANFGDIVCWCVKEFHRRAPVVESLNEFDDETLVLHLKKKLESYDIIVGHYTKGFDIPFLNAKLLLYGHPRLKKLFHVDTYYIARGKLKIARKSLEHIADSLGIREHKMFVPNAVWNAAKGKLLREDDPNFVSQFDAVEILKERCMSDVRLTEEVYHRLLRSNLIDCLRRY